MSAEIRTVNVGSTTGKELGNSTSELLAFHGATPVAQRAGASQAVVTLASATTVNASDLATAEALANALKADLALVNALVTEIRAALVEKGLIKGAA